MISHDFEIEFCESSLSHLWVVNESSWSRLWVIFELSSSRLRVNFKSTLYPLSVTFELAKYLFELKSSCDSSTVRICQSISNWDGSSTTINWFVGERKNDIAQHTKNLREIGEGKLECSLCEKITPNSLAHKKPPRAFRLTNSPEKKEQQTR